MLCECVCVSVSMRVHEPVRWPDLARLWGLQTAASLAAQGRVWWVYAWSRGSRERVEGEGEGGTCASVGVLIYGFVTITMCLHGAQQQVRRVRDPCAKCT